MNSFTWMWMCQKWRGLGLGLGESQHSIHQWVNNKYNMLHIELFVQKLNHKLHLLSTTKADCWGCFACQIVLWSIQLIIIDPMIDISFFCTSTSLGVCKGITESFVQAKFTRIEETNVSDNTFWDLNTISCPDHTILGLNETALKMIFACDCC